MYTIFEKRTLWNVHLDGKLVAKFATEEEAKEFAGWVPPPLPVGGTYRTCFCAIVLGAERAIKGGATGGVDPLVLRQLAGTPEPLLAVPAEVNQHRGRRRGRARRLPIRCDAVVQLPHPHWRMHGYSGVSGSGGGVARSPLRPGFAGLGQRSLAGVLHRR